MLSKQAWCDINEFNKTINLLLQTSYLWRAREAYERERDREKQREGEQSQFNNRFLSANFQTESTISPCSQTEY